MKAILPILALFAVSYPTYSQTPSEHADPPCEVGDAELFVALSAGGNFSLLKVYVRDALSGDPVINSGQEIAYSDFPGTRYDGCNWVGSNSSQESGVVSLPDNQLLEVSIEYNDNEVVTFLYAICAYPYEPSMTFYCGARGEYPKGTDMHVTISAEGDWSMDMFDYHTGNPILEIGNDDLIFPMDWHAHCVDNWPQDVAACDVRAPQIFVTTQLSDTSFVHADRDLVVPSGTSWTVGSYLARGRVHLAIPPARKLQVLGEADFSDLDFEHAAGSSFASIEVASTGALTLDGTHVDAVGDITVASGGDLSIMGGSVIEFDAGGELYSYGHLTIDGATLQKSGATDWSGLTLSGSGADGSSLVDMTYTAGSRVYVYNTDNVDISGSSITAYSSQGVRAESSSGLTISDSNLNYNTWGLSSYLSSVSLLGGSGVHYNSSGGITAGYSSLYLADGANPGNNEIENNGGHAMDVGYASVDMDYGYNSLVPTGSYYAIRASGGADVDATYNWFGAAPPTGKLSATGGATIDYSNYLPSDPNKRSPYAETGYPDDISAVVEGDDSPGAVGRFVRYLNSLRFDGGRRASEESARRVVADQFHPQRSVAAAYRVSDLAHLGESAIAVEFGERMLASAEIDGDAKRQIARDLLGVYLDQVGSISGALAMAHALREFGLDEVEERALDKLLARHGFETSGGKRPVEADEPATGIESYAYPNPFRKSSHILFSVDTDFRRVQVRVFDLLGREVARLYDGELRAGEYSLRFDASDLGAGQYFYRIEAGPRTAFGALFHLGQ